MAMLRTTGERTGREMWLWGNWKCEWLMPPELSFIFSKAACIVLFSEKLQYRKVFAVRSPYLEKSTVSFSRPSSSLHSSITLIIYQIDKKPVPVDIDRGIHTDPLTFPSGIFNATLYKWLQRSIFAAMQFDLDREANSCDISIVRRLLVQFGWWQLSPARPLRKGYWILRWRRASSPLRVSSLRMEIYQMLADTSVVSK